jgi:predicted nucleic acid-binding protein
LTAGYLLDTSVLSMLAPDKPTLNEALTLWLTEHSDRLYLSAVTVMEIEQGIGKLRRNGATDRADRLTRWLDTLLNAAADRVLALDGKVGRAAGALSDQALATGRHPGFADIAIAATATAHQLLLLTRNGKHFAPLGVAFFDPCEGLPTD